MPNFEQFAVVVVPFPLTEPSSTKRRPALVVSGAAFNASTGHSVLAMITSAKNPGWPQDVIITDLVRAGLPAASIVRMKLFTLENRSIIRQAGVLADKDRLVFGKAFKQLFDIRGLPIIKGSSPPRTINPF